MRSLSKIIIIAILLISASFCFAVSAPNWVPITGNQYNMIAFGHVNLDGVDLAKGGYVLYSFGQSGEADCRSKTEITKDRSYYTTILGNTAGEMISFKIYDSNTGNIYNLKDTLTFKIDAVQENFNLL